MNVTLLRISSRPVAIAAVLIGMVSLAIGAHAALNMRTLDADQAATAESSVDLSKKGSRIALVIGNGHYPDANAPLGQPINDARALSAELRRDGFDVDVIEDASKDDMTRAVARLKKLLEWFRPHWKSFDRMLVLKGPSWVEERAEARHYGLLQGLALRKLTTYPLPETKSESVLLQICPKQRERR